MAALPDLAVGSVLDLDERHLEHRPGELPLKPSSDASVLEHHPRRLRRRHQRRVGFEQHLVTQHVPVVLVVELVGGDDVLHHRGVVGEVGVGRALLLEYGGEARVHVGRRRGDGEEGGAVGEADGVGAGEHDEVVDAQAFDLEALDEPGEVEGRPRQEGERLVLHGHAAVQASPREAVVDLGAAEEEGGVAGGELDDVGAGDDAWAGLLERRLGRVHHVEATQAGEVCRAELLRPWVRRRRVEQH